MKKYLLTSPPGEQVRELAKVCGISEILATLYINRGVDTPQKVREFLGGDLNDLPSPFEMKGMKEGVEVILGALKKKRKILVWGDYDVDGIVSTVILTEFFTNLGMEVLHYIPHRIEEGYGLSAEGMKWAKDQGVQLIITVDCGSASLEEIRLAQKLGMEIVVTDHHKVEGELPGDFPLINPQQPGCPYPYKELAGVGVAFRLLQALGGILGVQRGVNDFLDLVALGTVSDVVPLVGENRILVKAGLPLLDHSPRPGINALKKTASLENKKIGSYEIGYAMGPRLNAAGRLQHADLGVALLKEQDPEAAKKMAEELEKINRTRQKVEEEIRLKIKALLEQNPQWDADPVLVLSSPDWHPGVIGITASRLCEQLGKPVFLVSFALGDGKGSARSRGEADIFALLSACADNLANYGGHKCAGGFSLKPEAFEAFAEGLKTAALSLEFREPEDYEVDLELKLSAVDSGFYQEIQELAPYGAGNPEPLFLSRGVKVAAFSLVGNGKKHLRMLGKQGDTSRKLMGFGLGEKGAALAVDGLYDVIYSLAEDSYNGEAEVYLKLKYFEPVGSAEKHNGQQVVDARKVSDRLPYIAQNAKNAGLSLVMVRLISQASELEERLKTYQELSLLEENPDSQAEGRVAVRTFPGLKDDLIPEQVFLIASPPGLEHFHHPVYQSKPRIHLLFGERELEWEENFQNLVFPDLPRLDLIYRTFLKAWEEKPFPASELAAMEQKLAHPGIKKITLESAFKVFAELNLVSRETGGLYRMRRAKPDFPASSTFGFFLRQRDDFARFKELFQNSLQLGAAIFPEELPF